MRWLIKSEPHVYAFTQLVKDKKTSWSGVRNYEARNNLRAMKKGELALYYHSGGGSAAGGTSRTPYEGKEIVGVARVVREAYVDPTSPAGEEWSTVDVAPVIALAQPVSLAAIKASAKLAGISLVKKARISVVSVTDAQFREVLKMAKTRLDTTNV